MAIKSTAKIRRADSIGLGCRLQDKMNHLKLLPLHGFSAQYLVGSAALLKAYVLEPGTLRSAFLINDFAFVQTQRSIAPKKHKEKQ